MARPKFDPAKRRLSLIRGIQAMRRKLDLEDVEPDGVPSGIPID